MQVHGEDLCITNICVKPLMTFVLCLVQKPKNPMGKIGNVLSNHVQTQKPLDVKGREPVLRKIYVS